MIREQPSQYMANNTELLMPRDPVTRAQNRQLCPCDRCQGRHERHHEVCQRHLAGQYGRQLFRRENRLLPELNDAEFATFEDFSAYVDSEEAQRLRQEVLQGCAVEEAPPVGDIRVRPQTLAEAVEDDLDIGSRQPVPDTLQVEEESYEDEDSSNNESEDMFTDELETDSDNISSYQGDRHILNYEESLALRMMQNRIRQGGSEALFANHVKSINTYLLKKGIEDIVPSHDRTVTLLADLTGMVHRRVDCCMNSCLAYTGQYANMTSCPHCKSERYKQKTPRRASGRVAHTTYDLTSVTKRLRLQYSSPSLAQTFGLPKGSSTAGVIADVWDGEGIANLRQRGFFKDSRDILLGLSSDGISLFKVGGFSVTPILLINYNFPQTERYKDENMYVLGIIPGPKKPKDMNSFFLPVVEELLMLEKGVLGWDAHRQESFTLRAHLAFLMADSPGMSAMIAHTGHSSYKFCWMCNQTGIYKKGVRAPLVPPTDLSPDRTRPPFKKVNPLRLDMRTHAQWMKTAQHIEFGHPVSIDQMEKQTASGVSGLSVFLVLKTIIAPFSFTMDAMHVVLENLEPLLFRCWTGDEFRSIGSGKKSKQKDTKQSTVRVGQTSNAALNEESAPPIDDESDGGRRKIDEGFGNSNAYFIPKHVWKQIGDEMEAAKYNIPGPSLPRIDTHHRRYTAGQRLQWLLTTPILLKDRLDRKYYLPWITFVQDFQNLLQAVTCNELENIRISIARFVWHFEAEYYRYEESRLHLCRSQIHALLHLCDSVKWWGPVTSYWQFPMEREAGLVKHKGHSRAHANRNISLMILYNESFKLLPLVAVERNQPSQPVGQLQVTTPRCLLGKHIAGDLRPPLTSREVNDLAEFYFFNSLTPTNLSLSAVRKQLLLDGPLHLQASCRARILDATSGAKQEIVVGSLLNISERNVAREKDNTLIGGFTVNGNNNGGQLIRIIGHVLYWATHIFFGKTFHLARVQSYHTCMAGGLLLKESQGRSCWIDLLYVTESYGTLKSAGHDYVVARRVGYFVDDDYAPELYF